MEHQDKILTPTEWNLMECLWDRSPRTGREAVEYLEEKMGWSRSTTLTLLRRMTEKGLIRRAEEGGVKVYSPLVLRSEAALRETDSFLSRVYRGSVSMMVSAMTEKKALSQSEIDALYAILKEAEGKVERDD